MRTAPKRLQVSTEQIKRAVQKWAVREKKRRDGSLRAHPTVLLEFLSGKKNFIENIYLYHKARDESPYIEWVATANGIGRFILTLETILDEWARLK